MESGKGELPEKPAAKLKTWLRKYGGVDFGVKRRTAEVK